MVPCFRPAVLVLTGAFCTDFAAVQSGAICPNDTIPVRGNRLAGPGICLESALTLAENRKQYIGRAHYTEAKLWQIMISTCNMQAPNGYHVERHALCIRGLESGDFPIKMLWSKR